MERRHKLLILIIVALLLLGFGVWYLLQPIFRSAQPPALPTGVKPSTALPAQRPTSTTGLGTTSLPQDLKALQDLAGIFVSRAGSGSSVEGFRGYADVLGNATRKYQDTLRVERATMQQVHPVDGPAYGISTRTVAVDASQAISGADIVIFVVQVQQAEDAGNPGKPNSVKYKQATVSFEKQTDKTYLVNGVVWKDIEL